jgi:hypothetical protein
LVNEARSITDGRIRNSCHAVNWAFGRSQLESSQKIEFETQRKQRISRRNAKVSSAAFAKNSASFAIINRFPPLNLISLLRQEIF